MLEKGLIIFTNGDKLNAIQFGMILPAGSIPIAMMFGQDDIRTAIEYRGSSYLRSYYNNVTVIQFANTAWVEHYPDNNNDDDDDICMNMGDSCKTCVAIHCTLRKFNCTNVAYIADRTTITDNTIYISKNPANKGYYVKQCLRKMTLSNGCFIDSLTYVLCDDLTTLQKISIFEEKHNDKHFIQIKEYVRFINSPNKLISVKDSGFIIDDAEFDFIKEQWMPLELS